MTAQHSTAQHSTAQHSTAQHSTAQHSTAGGSCLNLDGQSLNVTADKLARLKALFPEVFSEHQIDLNRLKQALGEDVFTQNEHYELSWAGKSQARREIQKTTSATLTPDENPSPAGGSGARKRGGLAEQQTAQHVFIEGENLEVLRVLQKSYFGRVKMIYIDPPYNTGNDSFVYPDDYTERLSDYKKRTGLADENGFINKQDLWRKNSKESGQYHSVWLSMMYPRLYLARNLLRDDGVIFISIDDNEAANLKLLCDEVFGAENFVDCVIWKKRYGGGAKEKHLVSLHEYVFFYARNINLLDEIFVPLQQESIGKYYKLKDEKLEKRGAYRTHPLEAGKAMDERVNLVYAIPAPDGTMIVPRKQWLWSEKRTLEALANNELEFIKGKDSFWSVHTKQYLFDENGKQREAKVFSIIDDVYTQHGTNEIIDIFENAKIFNYPKPTKFIRKLLDFGTNTNDIILDFFAGSGTTAQAVMELNLEDGGNRQCICVQMPEVLDETSEAHKAGYRTIADITRARITKVIAKLKAEKPMLTQNLACANFTLTPSHFKVWQPDILGDAAIMQQLELHQQAEHPASLQQNMLTELLLKMGLGLVGVEAKASLISVADTEIYAVSLPESGLLWLCFNPYKTALKAEIVKAKPQQIVFLNSCFIGSNADEQLTNLELELKQQHIKLTVI